MQGVLQGCFLDRIVFGLYDKAEIQVDQWIVIGGQYEKEDFKYFIGCSSGREYVCRLRHSGI